MLSSAGGDDAAVVGEAVEATRVALEKGDSLGDVDDDVRFVARGAWMPLVSPCGFTAATPAEGVGVMGEEVARCVVGNAGVVAVGVLGAEIGVECCGRALASFCG